MQSIRLIIEISRPNKTQHQLASIKLPTNVNLALDLASDLASIGTVLTNLNDS